MQFYDVHYTTTTPSGYTVEHCATFKTRDKDEAAISARHHYGHSRGFKILWIDALGPDPF